MAWPSILQSRRDAFYLKWKLPFRNDSQKEGGLYKFVRPDEADWAASMAAKFAKSNAAPENPLHSNEEKKKGKKGKKKKSIKHLDSVPPEPRVVRTVGIGEVEVTSGTSASQVFNMLMLTLCDIIGWRELQCIYLSVLQDWQK